MKNTLPVMLLIAGMAASAFADPMRDAEDAVQKRDAAGAIRILEQAAAAGDVAAKARLASYLRNFPTPHRDVERACRLAREAADAGDPTGLATRAECLAAGTEKADRPFVLARELARKALQAGLPAAGLTLYQVFTTDPQYRYSTPEGTPDTGKYNALAATPVAARADQVEAFDGLAVAMGTGNLNAVMIGLAYLIDSSAPGNVDLALGVAGVLRRNGLQLPDSLLPFLRMGEEIRGFGKTHVSITAFSNAYQPALIGAGLRIRALGAGECDAKEIKLVQVSAEPVSDAEYLPISKRPLANTYLVRGNWAETWTFSGCDKSVPVRMNFTADGWSGARFQTEPYAPGDAKKAQ